MSGPGCTLVRSGFDQAGDLENRAEETLKLLTDHVVPKR